MDTVKIIELKEDVLANNFEEAEKLRKELKERNIYLVNVMSSPGSGKTTTLKSLIEKLKNRYTVGVLEADIDGNVDAIEIAKSGDCRNRCKSNPVTYRRHVSSGCLYDAPGNSGTGRRDSAYFFGKCGKSGLSG